MTRYRVEIYDKAFTYKDHSGVSSKDISTDYLVLDTSVVTVPKILDAESGDYISVKADGAEAYTGIVTNVQYEKESTTVSFVDFMTLLDFTMYVNQNELSDIEGYISDTLNGIYAGSDTTQRRTGFSATTDGISTAVKVSTDETTVNLFEFATRLLKVGIVIRFTLNVPGKALNCYITHIDTDDVEIIRVKDADVNECVIDVRAAESDLNKIKYFNNASPSTTLTYYLHTDGTIDTSSASNRITPVIYEERGVDVGEDETFASVTLADAEGAMVLNSYNNEIDVTVNAETKLFKIGNIGSLYQIIATDGTIYTSILTGYESVNSKYMTLKFGFIRTDLTAVLKMQRRKK